MRTPLLLCALIAALPHSAPAQEAAPPRDGQHDFDFEIGPWKAHVKRLVHPLTGSTTWVEYDGTHVVRKVWDGRANLGELELDGPAGHIEGLSLRLYNPQSHQWSETFSNSRVGVLGSPLVGEFKDGRGEFIDQEPVNGRAVLVRSTYSAITPTSYHSDQAYSGDGGKTWEVNWIATYTRLKAAPESPAPPAARQSLDDAWWTGPMMANSAATLPRGHFLVEPYLYDVIAANSHGFGSRAYVLYGLADRLTVGFIPIIGFTVRRGGPNGSGIGLGDTSPLAQFRLTRFHAGSLVPTTAIQLQESFPTGNTIASATVSATASAPGRLPPRSRSTPRPASGCPTAASCGCGSTCRRRFPAA